MHPQKKKTKKETSPAHAVNAVPPLQSKPRAPCTPVCDCVSPARSVKRGRGGAWPGGNLPLSTVCGSYH